MRLLFRFSIACFMLVAFAGIEASAENVTKTSSGTTRVEIVVDDAGNLVKIRRHEAKYDADGNLIGFEIVEWEPTGDLGPDEVNALLAAFEADINTDPTQTFDTIEQTETVVATVNDDGSVTVTVTNDEGTQTTTHANLTEARSAQNASLPDPVSNPTVPDFRANSDTNAGTVPDVVIVPQTP